MKKLLTIASLLAVITAGTAVAANRGGDKVVEKIISTGTTDNRTMDHEDYLTNMIGGRLVGSHALVDAESWVISRFKEWGLEVQVQEVGQINVGFDRGPWKGRMLSEDGMELHFSTPSYTRGTHGPQKGHVVIEPKTRKEFDRIKGRLKGAWVLVSGKSTGFPIDWSAKGDAKRAEALEKGEDAPALFYKEMVDAGILGIIQAADVPIKGLYDRNNCYDMTMDNLPKVPDIKLDADQYEKIRAKVLRKDRFELEFDIRNHFYPGPVKYHNILGIIRGSRYPGEYVISGSHLDSFDTATGAIDDGQGTAVNMESARLLATSGAKPERTVIFAIWTAEEYGLYGSKYFVENKTVPLEKISNYFNRDGGPEVAAAVTVRPAMYDDFVKICEPVSKINPDFPFEVRKDETPAGPRPEKAGGSDHAYFAMNGVPTISIDLEDSKGYGFSYGEIWHSENDLYNKAIPEYMEHSAVVNAILVYGVANLDHLISREGLYTN